MLIPPPPLEKGGWRGGFDVESFTMLLLQFPLIFQRRGEVVHEVY